MAFFKVPVDVQNEPPDDGETQPAEEKAEREHEENIAPATVKHGIEEVCEHFASLLALQVGTTNVDDSAFRYHSPFEFLCV